MFDGLSWETFLFFTVDGLGEVIKNMVQPEPFTFELALPSDVLLSKKLHHLKPSHCKVCY
jgi:hypothetical protein